MKDTQFTAPLPASLPIDSLKGPALGSGAAIMLNGVPQKIGDSSYLVDVLNAAGHIIPQVCYHPQFGPIQTCDTCMVEVDGQLVRACATKRVPLA